MTRQAVTTSGAPAAIGPYSQGIASADLVFCSGQLGLDPASGELAEGVEAQAERALRNLAAVLDAAGCSWADVVKTTIYLADIGDFGAVNARLRPVHARPAAGPLHVRRRGAAQGRPDRDRRDRPPPELTRGRATPRPADMACVVRAVRPLTGESATPTVGSWLDSAEPIRTSPGQLTNDLVPPGQGRSGERGAGRAGQARRSRDSVSSCASPSARGGRHARPATRLARTGCGADPRNCRTLRDQARRAGNGPLAIVQGAATVD